MRDDRKILVWQRALWTLTAFVLFAVGLGRVWWPASQRIAQVRSDALELYEEANSFDATTRRAADLRATQARVEADLRLLGGIRSQAAVTAALLTLLHDRADRNGVEVRDVSPARESPKTSGSMKHLLSGADLAIGLRGPFRNVVAFIADLPRHDVLIDVHDIRVASSPAGRRVPILDVTVHATAYRVTSLPTTGANYARTP